MSLTDIMLSCIFFFIAGLTLYNLALINAMFEPVIKAVHYEQIERAD